jgi:hypothetical protein
MFAADFCGAPICASLATFPFALSTRVIVLSVDDKPARVDNADAGVSGCGVDSIDAKTLLHGIALVPDV